MSAADCAVISLDRAEFQPATLKNSAVSVVHFLVGNIHAFNVFIKGIKVFHDKFATAHKSEARSNLVAVFVLYLIEHKRQLFIRTHFIAD